MYLYESKRLAFRNWTSEDIENLVSIQKDPHVMQFFPNLMTKQQTHEYAEFMQDHYKRCGYTYFALILKDTNECIGYCGMIDCDAPTPFKDPVEIGWKIAKDKQRQGYALEAASYMIKVCFEKFDWSEIVTTTTKLNRPSINLIEKLGFKEHVGSNYRHPRVPIDSPLSEHILYSLSKNR